MELASRGASAVVLASRATEKLEDAGAQGIRGLRRPGMAVETDVADRDSVEAMVERAMDEFGRIDVLVNNAGARALRAGRGAAARGPALRLRGEHHRAPELRAGGAPADGERGAHHQRLLRRRQARHPEGRRLLLDKVRPERPLGRPARRGRRPGHHRDERLPRHDPDRLQGQLPAHKGREARLAPEGRRRPERVAQKIADAAEKGPRDVYVTLSDRLFVAGTTLLPGLTDRVLRVLGEGLGGRTWASGRAR